MEIKKLRFEPGALSIIQMGEELIGHPSTAINEIVKNAYDADACNCWVYTQYHNKAERTFLIVKDDGIGMTEDILFGDWLRPSVSSKRNLDSIAIVSKIFKRKFLGSKGIGRLAAMALGRYLTVISKQNIENEYNWLRLDREIFKVEDLLDKITFPGGKIKNYLSLFEDENILKINNIKRDGYLINILKDNLLDDFSEGTLIVVQLLDESIRTIIEDEFNSKEIENTSIFKALRDLITPLKLNMELQDELIDQKIISKKQKIDNGEGTFDLYYGINFIIDHIKRKIDFLPVDTSPILKYYDYRVYGRALKDASVKCRYECRRKLEDEFVEDFDISSSFNLSDENLRIRRIEGIEIDNKYKNPNVGEFYFDFRIYDLDSDAKEKLAKILKVDGRREATRILTKYLGLKISKNGFGIKPYGEEEKDWLGLGAKRVQKHIETIGPNQIIGNIFLFSPENDTLNEKTNREGFFENKAFIIFKKIIDGILEETGRKRAWYRKRHNLGRQTKSKHDRPNTEKFIQYVLSSTTDLKLIDEARKFIDETNTAFDNIEHSLSFSQRLATLGTGIELVYHELSQPISSLGAARTGINIITKKISQDDIKNRITLRIQNISNSITSLQELKNSLQPAIGKSLPKRFSPLDTIKKVCYLFNLDLERHNIVVEISNTLNNYEIKDLEYIFWVSFLNIVNNAVYWLQFTDKKRIIIFELLKDTIAISNTGPKLPELDLELIFDYGVTSKKEKNATGLGLSFTRNLLSHRDWEIWAENRDYGPIFYIGKSD